MDELPIAVLEAIVEFSWILYIPMSFTLAALICWVIVELRVSQKPETSDEALHIADVVISEERVELKCEHKNTTKKWIGTYLKTKCNDCGAYGHAF